MHGSSHRLLLPLAALSLPLVACESQDGPATIDERRVASRPTADVAIGASSLDRFGDPFAPAPAAESPEPPLTWVAPPGWREVPPRSQFRLVDFELGGGAAECYVTLLPGSAGGVRDNVNRWATDQLGLAPLTVAEVEALPRHPVLGAPAYLYEAAGNYTGMGSEAVVDGALKGLILEEPEFTLFVKLVGERETVEAERRAFLDFGASLRTRSQARSATAGGDNNSAAPRAPGVAPVDGAVGGAVGAPPAAAAPYEYELPSGWTLEGPRPMRLLSFDTGAAGSVSVSRAGGTLEQNLARWYGQMGLDAPVGTGVLALERITVLGLASFVVDLEGDFTGMSGGTVPDQRLLGVICPLEGESLFIKLVGPTDAVAAERDALLAFARSLRPVGGD